MSSAESSFPELLLSSATPSPSALLDWLRGQIDDQMLLEIAKADYEEEVEDHLAGIKRQLSDDPLTGLLPWCPLEVLSLVSHGDPEYQTAYEPASDKRHQHIRRLLACTILLVSAATLLAEPPHLSEEEFFLDTQQATLIYIVRCGVFLDNETAKLVLGLLLWLWDQEPFRCLKPFLAFGSFILWVSINTDRYMCKEIASLFRWVVEEEQPAFEGMETVETNKWLLRLNDYALHNEVPWYYTASDILNKQSICAEEIGKIIDTYKHKPSI